MILRRSMRSFRASVYDVYMKYWAGVSLSLSLNSEILVRAWLTANALNNSGLKESHIAPMLSMPAEGLPSTAL